MIPLLALVAFMAGWTNAALKCHNGNYGYLGDDSKCWAPDINRLVGGSWKCDSYGAVSDAHVQKVRIHCNYRARGSAQTAGWTRPWVVHSAH